MTNEEMILKAREAKSPDELLKMAHGAGMTDFTDENARVYFNALNQSGEMSDEEIDAAGGGWPSARTDRRWLHIQTGAVTGNVNTQTTRGTMEKRPNSA